jgi:hypothetical protein
MNETSNRNVYVLVAAIFFGGLLPIWLTQSHWFVGESLSIFNPIKWVLLGGWLGGFLLGGVHSQNDIGAYLGAGLVAGAMFYVLVRFSFWAWGRLQPRA